MKPAKTKGLFRHSLLVTVSMFCFAVVVAQTSATTSYSSPAKTAGKVRFYNTGNIAAKIYRTTTDNQKTFVSEIAGNSGIDVDAKLGEGFTVDLNDPTITHRKIYIVDLDQTIFIYGNVSMKDFAGYGMTFSALNFDPNLYGVDSTILNTKNVMLTMNKAQIFERLNSTLGIDYETQPPYLIKMGFNYAGLPLTISTGKARTSYGYSAYSAGWNIGGSGKFPVKAVDISGGFGYGETQSNQSSTMDVYTYSRHQAITHQVVVSPTKAYLDPVFIDRVKRINSAAAADQLVMDYGTHFPETVFYGGDLSSYLRMSSVDFTKANSMNLDVEAAVEVSTPTTKEQKGYSKTKTSQGSTYGGKLNFGMNNSQEQRSLLEKSESQCRVIGGEYSPSGEYMVNEGNSAPLAVSLKRLDELIDPRVFKDDSDPARLSQIQQLVKGAVDRYIKARARANTSIPLPPPQVYSVTLTKMSVTGHLDDANANTKGSITAAVYSDNTLKNKIVHPAEQLWSQGGYSLDFRFSPNNNKEMQSRLYFTHYPDAATGKFKPFYLNVAGNITEKDDIVWAPNGANFSGGSGPIDLSSLKLQPGGAAVTRSIDMSRQGSGSIRISYSIQKEETFADGPDGMDAWNTSVSPTIGNDLDSEAELTLINGGGYSAMFKVNYTVEGHQKSYESGNVAMGWRYKLALPPNAKNIKVEGYYHNLFWRRVFEKSETVAADKCYKLYGTIFNAKQNNECD